MKELSPEELFAGLAAAVQEGTSGTLLLVRVTPRSRRVGILGFHGGRLKVGVAAAPEDGNANKELVKFLAHRTKLRQQTIQVISGLTNRDKTILFEGITLIQLKTFLGTY